MVPLLSSCFSGLLSRCKSQNGNKDGLIVLKTRDSDHGADALLTYIAPAFLKRDGFTHVLIYGNATRFLSDYYTNKCFFKAKRLLPNPNTVSQTEHSSAPKQHME